MYKSNIPSSFLNLISMLKKKIVLLAMAPIIFAINSCVAINYSESKTKSSTTETTVSSKQALSVSTQEAVQEALAKMSPSEEKMLKNCLGGIAASGAGEYKTAIQFYTECLSVLPKEGSEYPAILMYRGFAYYSDGMSKKAIDDYNQSIASQSKGIHSKDTYIRRGDAYSQLGDRNTAIKDYTKAIELDSASAVAYNARARVYSELKKHTQAISDYTKVLKIDPDYLHGYINRGLALSSIGNEKEAIEDYNKAIGLDVNYAAAYYNRALSQSALSNKKAAKIDFQKAADLYLKDGNSVDAQDALNKIKTL